MAEKSSKKKKKCSNKRILPRVGNNFQAEIPAMVEKPDLDHSDHRYSLAVDQRPDSSDAELGLAKTWTEIEKDSFVLGLYLFGKNLNLVKKVVGSDKEMGDILCFYYGKFYDSVAYLRWSKCLNSSHECRVFGDKIFTGSRHEKLLARLFYLVSNDIQDMLIQSSVNFSNQKLSFEDYVFTLKDIVGIDVLVKAVGIGRGKKNLARTPRKQMNKSSSPIDCERSPNSSLASYHSEPRRSLRARAAKVESSDEVIEIGELVPLDHDNNKQPSENEPKKFLFDLNLPYVPSDSEDEFLNNNELTFRAEELPEDEAIIEGHQTSNGRRQSLRSRPMTKRALEALEHEFVSSKKRKM